MSGIAGEVSFSEDGSAVFRNEREYTDDGNFTLVFSGKLFNSDEIKNELSVSGKCSDGEIVLRSFIKWREKCVVKMNGVFSFAVWDKKERKLFFARDRIGVKPFFYAVKHNKFIFGSQIKDVLQSKSVEPVIDENSIAEIMFIGPGRTPGCGVFKDISELKPACYGYFTENGIRLTKYWTLKDKENTDTFEETVERVRFLVNDSIKRQLSRDTSVGTFLSGGLDSSIVSAVSNSYIEKLKTFSVTYENNDEFFKKSRFQPNSDTEYIKIMADFLGCEHHLITLKNEDLANALYEAVDARDLPGMADVDSSLLLFCKEIKKHCDVALSGECADEIFGGYPWYRDKDIRMINGFPWAQSTEYRRSFLKADIKLPDSGNYVYSRYRDTIINASKCASISPAEARMKEMMKLNLDWFMQTLLDRNDRMSAESSLTVRAPFCDYRIVEYLYSVPWEYKDYKSYEKGLLREAFKDILPEKVLWRKKSPYPKTHNPEYFNIVSEMLREIIGNPSSPLLSFIKKEELQKLLKTERNEPWYGQLMTTPQTIAYFVQVDYWLRKYKIIIK